MLQIVIPPAEQWNSQIEEFVYTNPVPLQLEHSLVSMAKWESKWKKPFLSSNNKTREEIVDYIRCMTITQNVDPKSYDYLSENNIKQINNYINDQKTATTFKKELNVKNSREIITSELIYYWMIALNIPFECQKWHLNRLLTLIRICNIKNSKPKKRSTSELLREHAALNAARRKKH